MATYITLGKFTEQGIRSVKDTITRADAVKEAGSKFGVSMQSIHWVQGQYDLVAVWEAKDEIALNAFALSVATAGNVKLETLRAYGRDEMSQILAKMP